MTLADFFASAVKVLMLALTRRFLDVTRWFVIAVVVSSQAFAGDDGTIPTCSQRAAWAQVGPAVLMTSSRAESLSAVPVPWSADTYLEFSRTGVRTNADQMMSSRQRVVRDLVLAECTEWRMRHRGALEDLLRSIAQQPTWVLPAHDKNLDVFQGRTQFIDLGAAEMASTLAMAVYLLQDELSVETRERVLSEIRRRVLQPFLVSLQDSRRIPQHWWLTRDSNWNAVCISGVVIAAIFSDLPEQQKQQILDAAAGYIRYFEDSYLSDGYAVEGLAYWSYGVSRYVLLREFLLAYTAASVDIIHSHRQVEILQFARRFRLSGNLYPPYADSRLDAAPSPSLVEYVDEAMGFSSNASATTAATDSLPALVFSAFNRPSPVRVPLTTVRAAEDWRIWFPVAQVYLGKSQSPSGLSASFKVGGNGGHSHNDLGSYVISRDGRWVSGDPGGPRSYDADSFSAKRYTLPLFNSYGHPVPMIDGQLQGDASRIRLMARTQWSDGRDRIFADITPAYASIHLRQVLREFTYGRQGSSYVEISDTLTAQSAQMFEVPVITERPMVELEKNRRYRIDNASGSVSVEIEADFPLVSRTETLTQNGVTFVRQGFAAASPIRGGRLTVRYRPMVD